MQQVADLLQQRPDAHHSAPLPQPPAWLVNWERKRPALLVECLAEAIGVFMYVFPGLGASAAFLVTTVAKEPGFGALLNIGIAYALGIVCALCFPASLHSFRGLTDELDRCSRYRRCRAYFGWSPLAFLQSVALLLPPLQDIP